jgi:hypothetical protein
MEYQEKIRNKRKVSIFRLFRLFSFVTYFLFCHSKSTPRLTMWLSITGFLALLQIFPIFASILKAGSSNQ